MVRVLLNVMSIMSPNCGALAALGLLSVIGYLFWRGTVVVMNARRLLEKGALLLDAGTPAEFSAGHVVGSVNIPEPDVVRRQKEIGALSRPIVVYARSGLQSARTTHALRAIGYHSVTNVGPMSRWDVHGRGGGWVTEVLSSSVTTSTSKGGWRAGARLLAQPDRGCLHVAARRPRTAW